MEFTINTVMLYIHFFLDQTRLPTLSDQDKANALGAYFASVYFQTKEKASNSIISNSDSNIVNTTSSLRMTPNEVSEYLKKLRPSTTSTFDGIPQIFL